MTRTMTIRSRDTITQRENTLGDWDAQKIAEYAQSLDGKPLHREPAIGEPFRLSFNRPEIESVVVSID